MLSLVLALVPFPVDALSVVVDEVEALLDRSSDCVPVEDCCLDDVDAPEVVDDELEDELADERPDALDVLVVEPLALVVVVDDDSSPRSSGDSLVVVPSGRSSSGKTETGGRSSRCFSTYSRWPSRS